MWINPLSIVRWTSHSFHACSFIVLVVLLSACGGNGNRVESKDAKSAAATKTEPAAKSAEPATLAELFPAGPGRSLVLESCGNCHSAACAAIGQRTAERWDALKADHRDKVTSLSEQDRETVFGYLKENFNDSKPEPKVPPQLMQAGCTPF
jgi:hypothetical protein